MDGYYRNGDLLDHKVKADEAVAQAEAGAHRGAVHHHRRDGRQRALDNRARLGDGIGTHASLAERRLIGAQRHREESRRGPRVEVERASALAEQRVRDQVL